VKTVALPQVRLVGEEDKSPVATLPLSEIVRRIYQLESSGGKNDSCHRHGLHNDFGLGIYGNHEDCYQTTDEVRTKVTDWFDKKLKNGYSLEASLCGYNTGSFVNSCNYLEKFNSLL